MASAATRSDGDDGGLPRASTDDEDVGTRAIALDSDEERLFQVLVETVVAYESGRIALPDDDEEPCNNGDGGGDCSSSSLPAAPPLPRSPLQSQQSSSRPHLQLELRVAGGWVRDKLLGLETHDVDIAINKLTGAQFARLVQQYQALAHRRGDGQDSEPHRKQRQSKIGIIAANPEQSKHLETATMVVCGIEVDFTNLRSEEVYEVHSRIPIVKFGTPLEDALRRDFTVNALFYNLLSRQVEDFTGRGMRDLQQGRLVTPLCPLTTFRDDPLRVLRAVRFAVRYSFELDHGLRNSAQNDEIHKALHVKVSRERVGKELEGMLSGKGAAPIRALQLISQLKLAGPVFALPVEHRDGVTAVFGVVETSTTTVSSTNVRALSERSRGMYYREDMSSDSPEARHIRERGWEESVAYLQLLPDVVERFQQRLASPTVVATPSSDGNASAAAGAITSTTQLDCRLLPLAVFLLPFRQLRYRHQATKNRQCRESWAVSYVFRDGIKFKNKDVQAVTTLMESLDSVLTYLTEYAIQQRQQQQQSDSALAAERLRAGLLLRSTKELWVTSLALATVVKCRQSQLGHDGLFGSQQPAGGAVDWTEISLNLYQQILSIGLDGCWKMRPLLDGKAVIQALDLPRGPEIGTYLDEQMRWMLLNPAGTREQCRDHLMSVKRRLLDGEGTDPQNLSCHGISDGTGKALSSAVDDSETANGGGGDDSASVSPHFSKKMHVESMDVS